MKCIYRLFIAGTMLRDIKVPNKGKFHNYPKVILMNLLILDYWRTQDHVVWKMMKSNFGILNEESGEQTFSLLGRSVLGDTVLSQFDHMNKVYSLLPITRSIKGEIMQDQHSSSSISWRHTIHDDSDEVRARLQYSSRTQSKRYWQTDSNRMMVQMPVILVEYQLPDN